MSLLQSAERFLYSDNFVLQFDWTDQKACFAFFVTCDSCGKKSMHLSYENFSEPTTNSVSRIKFRSDIDIDSEIFYSVPTSFFVLDERIPVVIRELITEAEGCIKMNFLTGASACMRKAIYELTVLENAEGADYESKIKFLKKKDLVQIQCSSIYFLIYKT